MIDIAVTTPDPLKSEREAVENALQAYFAKVLAPYEGQLLRPEQAYACINDIDARVRDIEIVLQGVQVQIRDQIRSIFMVRR